MRVLFFSPGFPAEMPFFVEALAEVGARVVGLGDQPAEALPERARRALSDYVRVDSLWDTDALASRLRRGGGALERVECLWEPGMLVAAQLREALELPGMTVAETVPFRDKTRMKEVLQAAGSKIGVEDGMINFQLEARDNREKIAQGFHRRRAIKVERFGRYVKRKAGAAQ